MAYDEPLANRVRHLFEGRRGVVERKMFGGLAFLLQGRMCCGIVGNDLMVRVPLDDYEVLLRRRHVRPMDFTGKPLKGFVYVAPAALRTSSALRRWVARGEGVAKNSPHGAAWCRRQGSPA
jgi:TfoX/Sxy family transcriptional regulator of competence genes